MPAAHTQGQAWPVIKASGDDRIEMGFVQVVRKKRKLVLIEDSGALENVKVTGGYQQKQRLPAKFRLSEETVAKRTLQRCRLQIYLEQLQRLMALSSARVRYGSLQCCIYGLEQHQM